WAMPDAQRRAMSSAPQGYSPPAQNPYSNLQWLGGVPPPSAPGNIGAPNFPGPPASSGGETGPMQPTDSGLMPPSLGGAPGSLLSGGGGATNSMGGYGGVDQNTGLPNTNSYLVNPGAGMGGYDPLDPTGMLGASGSLAQGFGGRFSAPSLAGLQLDP